MGIKIGGKKWNFFNCSESLKILTRFRTLHRWHQELEGLSNRMKIFASLLMFTAHFDKYAFSLSLLEIRLSHSYSSNSCPNLFWSHEKWGRFWVLWNIWLLWKILIQHNFPLNFKHFSANIIPLWKPGTERLIKQVSNKHLEIVKTFMNEICMSTPKCIWKPKTLYLHNKTKVWSPP